MDKKLRAVSLPVVVVPFMILYLLLLTWIILFKANPNVFHSLFDPDLRGLSFIPAFNSTETLLNYALFVPLGVFLYLMPGRLPLAARIALSAALSLSYEVTQYILCIGTADITDLISNTLGGAAGTLISFMWIRLFGQESSRFLGIAGCSSAILLFILLCFVL